MQLIVHPDDKPSTLKKESGYDGLIVLAIIALGMLILYLYDLHQYETICANPMLTKGCVMRECKGSKGRNYIIYTVAIHDKYYLNKYHTRRTDLKGHCFPVVYARDNPDYNVMLIYKSDYEYYNIPYPDSLDH